MVLKTTLRVLKVLSSEYSTFLQSSLVQNLYILAKANIFFFILDVIKGFLAALIRGRLRSTRGGSAERS